MKIQTKTILLLLSLMGTFILFFIGFQYLRNMDHRIHEHEKMVSDTRVVQSVLEFHTESFMKPTKDNSSWDEMYEFVQTPNVKWAQENFHAVRSNYEMSFLGAFDTLGHVVFSVNDSNSQEFMLNNIEIEEMFLHSKTIHAFMFSKDILYEVFGAAIVPTTDNLRQTKPKGYLVSAKQLDTTYIKHLEKATGSHVSIIPLGLARNHTAGNQIIYNSLNDVHGKPIATLAFEKTDKTIAAQKTSNMIVFVGMGFLLLATVLFFVLTNKWLTLPMKKIVKSLTTENTESQVFISDQQNDFDKIESLIAKFKVQKLRLSSELEENKKSHEKIRKLSTAVEQSANSIVITDIFGNIEYVNPFFTQLTGYSMEEALGKNPRILKSDTQDQHFYKNLWETITSGKEWRGDFLNKKKNGDHYWESASITPIKNNMGEITHFIAIKEDITARKEAERLTQEAKEFAELIYAVTPSAIFTVNSEKIITSWNKKATLITGYSASEMIGKKCTTFAEGPCHLSCGLLNNNIQKPINAKECSITHKSGKRLTISKNVDVLKDAQGNAIGGIESFEDITKQKKTEKELKDSEQRYSTLVHQLPDPVIIHRNGEILFVNNAALLIFGYKAYELIGAELFNFIGEESSEKYLKKYTDETQHQASLQCPELFKPLLHKTHEHTPIGDFEVKVKTKDGNLRDVILKTDSIIFDGEASFVSIMVDITERKNIETALRLAKDDAEKANQAKSDFLATMSHEIRTPLNGVIGMTDLALTTKLSNSQRDYLESAQISAYLLLDTINNILDFSKIEAGKLEIENVEFNLREVIERSIDILTVKAFEKKVELLCEIEPQLPDYFLGDPLRIRQIMVNLIGNAIKFTNKGEICVSVKITSKQNDRARVLFNIRDTGIGIPKNRIEGIFESFTQADSSTTRKYGGSGLGLAISKNLTELMHGKIFVESEPGKGSAFSFELPLQIAKTSGEAKPDTELEIKKVLVVDDNVTNLKIMKDMLNHWNISTVLSSDGNDALDILRQSIKDNDFFDLVILDMHMPEMDGLTLTVKIREELKPNFKPLILMFSSLEKEMLQSNSATISGIDKFLTKPVKMSDLRDTLQQLGKNDFQKNTDPAQDEEKYAPSYSGKTILVAEDNIINMKLLKALLNTCDVRILQAQNGAEAISLFQKEPLDLIFMDVHMPGTDGFQAVEAIRKIENGISHIPIIALTALAMRGDREKCIASGMDDYLSKPFKKERLFECLEKYLGITNNCIEHSETVDNRLTDKNLVFNKPELLVMTGNNLALYKEILNDYRNMFPELFEKLKQAIHCADFSNTEYFSHTLKGMSGNIRALEIRKICEEIEHSAVSLQSFEEIAITASLLENAYHTFLQVIENELA